MLLKSLSLTNFRNYSKADFTFSSQTTLILGPNAVGKTNLLEAIYYLASGKSFRASYDREAIRRGENICHLQGDGNDSKLGLSISFGDNESGNRSQKRFKINGVGKRLSDFAGNLRAVYFGPEEILLVTGSPSRRRRFMDSVLIQVDQEYARVLSEYEKILRQRNRLLKLIREGEALREQLGVWDPKLLDLGSVLSKKRQEMFVDFNARLKDSGLVLLFETRPACRQAGRYPNKKEFREREIEAGMTLWGPHREDFRFVRVSVAVPFYGAQEKAAQSAAATNDLAPYGSRGEQRLAVLRLKLAELEFISEQSGGRPILLLDDIFSELDEGNRNLVLKLFNKQQTIVTATDLDQIDGENGDFLVIQL